MSVVLSILQGIGWLLLLVLCLILLIFLAIMCAPVRYELEGDFREEQWAKAHMRWLFRLFRVRIVYEDDLVFIEIRIFTMSKTFSFELNKEKEEVEEEAEKVKEAVEEEIEKPGIIDKIKGIINLIRELYPKLKKMITDEKNKAAVRHIKDELLFLLKTILPRESKVDAVFSTGSPDTTGQAYGAVSCLPVFYRDNWKLLPDFTAEEAYFHGYFWAKGRVYGYELTGILLRILLDKNCRRMYTMIMKFVKYVKHKTSQEDK